MTGICYIVANTLPPSFGWQTRARGLRGAQLSALARFAFEDVRMLLFLERFHFLHNERGFAILAPARAGTTIISLNDFEAFADRIAPATFVFTQAEFVDKAAHAAERHTIVYDILSLREFTLRQSGASDAQLRESEHDHRRMLKLADRTFINGAKSAAHLSIDLEDEDAAVVPFAPPPVPVAARNRTHLLFGGPMSRWTDVTPLFRTMSAYLSHHRDHPTIMLAPEGQAEDANALEYSAIWLMDHVTVLWNLSALNDAEMLAMCFGFVDWAPLTAERAYGSSLCTLQAVAAGVPVLHQKGTGLDGLWDPFPGERLEMPLTPGDVETFVANARRGAYVDAVRHAQEVLAALRSDPHLFAGLQPCA